MNKSTRELLKSLLANEKNIPQRFWRDNWPIQFSSLKRPLWLQNDQSLGLYRSGSFYFLDAKGKPQVRSWKGFFAQKSKKRYNEKRIIEVCNNFLMIVNQENLNAKDILRCSNVEIRNFLVKQYGHLRFFKELSGEIIHREGDSELISLQLVKDEEPLTVVKVKDSTTGEFYILRVPPTVKTCKEAIAWTFGFEPDEYNPIIET